MKAAFFDAPGPPDVFRYADLPTPDPQPGQVRVRVMAASVNPIDTYIRGGLVAMPQPRPTIPGADFAGVVDAVGHGVSRFKPGDAVWGSNQGMNGRPGTFAEFCCPPQEWVHALPAGVEPKAAAAVALVGITAHLGLFERAKLSAGEWVFVNGGTGGVGACVVQMAKAVGAKVIATVGSLAKAATATSLGADVVIDYTRDDIAASVRGATQGKGVDVWFETLPPTDLDRTFDLTAPRGRVVLMAGRQARPAFPNGAFYPKGQTIHGFAMFAYSASEQSAAGADIGRWLASGELKPLIGAEFPLSQAADAHKLQEDNTLRKAGTLTGKIVVLPT